MADLSKEKVNQLYSELLIDPNFERLELLRNQPNIFEILGVSHYEIRHSHFLAWIFNPNGNHGIGDYFLKRFLIQIIQDSRVNLMEFSQFKKLDVLSTHQLLQENLIIHREKHNIDILIEFDSTIIVIENKIHSGEGNDQLQRYKDIVVKNYSNKKPIFVYLTKFGEEASLKNYFIEVSYQEHILLYLNDLVEYKSDTIQDHVLTYIKDYIDNLNKNIMKQDPANILAEKLYRQHQDLFDFIIANRPDSIAIIREKMNELLVKDKFVLGSDHKHFSRFLPHEINSIVPRSPNNKGWKEGELFLWELRYPTNSEKIEFKIAINPTYINKFQFIEELFEKANLTLYKRFNDNWLVYESKLYNIEYARIYDEGYIEIVYQQIMEEQRPKIDKLSQIILANQTIFK